jgi:uncharacterized protein YlxW (UPF0749 family)
MSMWTAIMVIAIAAIVAEAFRQRNKDKLSAADKQEIASINRRLDSMETDLRQRVETLERIVTDSNEDLKRQFDHLDKTG